MLPVVCGRGEGRKELLSNGAANVLPLSTDCQQNMRHFFRHSSSITLRSSGNHSSTTECEHCPAERSLDRRPHADDRSHGLGDPRAQAGSSTRPRRRHGRHVLVLRGRRNVISRSPKPSDLQLVTNRKAFAQARALLFTRSLQVI
jgi:hypothetical protein